MGVKAERRSERHAYYVRNKDKAKAWYQANKDRLKAERDAAKLNGGGVPFPVAVVPSTRSKPTLNQKLIPPRYETPVPDGIAGSYGDAAIAWAGKELGLTPYPWQEYVIRNLLRHDVDGNLIHRIGLLSTARQNGKSVIVRIIFGWLLDEGRKQPPFSSWRTMLTAAHDAKQARLIYKGVYDDLMGIKRIRDQALHGGRRVSVKLTEHFGIEIEGLALDTVTGQPGSARGHSAGIIAWDEMLTQRDWDMWAALAPTQSAQRSPLMILTSTAGHSDSVILRSFYDRLVRQATGAEPPDPSFYGAWWQSEEPDVGLEWPQLQRANPALEQGQLTRAYIESTEWGILPPDEWQRERGNHFVDRVADAAIAPLAWAKCRTAKPLKDAEGPFALGVDVARKGVRATIAVAGVREDGRIGVEIYRDIRPTRDELVSPERIVTLIKEFEQPAKIAYDKAIGAASAFERAGEESTVEWDGLGPAAMIAACMDVAEMIQSGRLAVDDPLLDAQVKDVVRRDVGSEGAYRFSRGLSIVPIDAFMAATLAAHAIAYSLRLPQIF